MKLEIPILSVLMIVVLVSSGCITTTYEFVCPEFENLELETSGSLYYVSEWDLEDYVSKSDSGTIEIVVGHRGSCKKGSEAGENVNYWYCEHILITQRLIDKKSNIISTLDRRITIVFDENKKYLETKC